MTENEIHARLQHMLGSSDGSVLPNLSTSPYNSKVLKKGEQVYYADLRQWKTGDGVTTIANLPFDNAESKNNISWSSKAGGTSVGWINIAQIQLNTNNHTSGIEFVLHVFRVYTAPQAEDYIFSITTGWNNPNITQINGSGGTRIIEKFRFAVDSTNHILYIQMYVNTSYSTYTNEVQFTLINRWDKQRAFVVPITSGAVADTYNTYLGEIETSIQYPFVGKGLYSNMPQGTAPLKVNSTTQVNNLNADLLDGIHASGFALVDGSNATSAGVSAMINALTTASETPDDADYYVSQSAGGGTTTTTYHRRPLSALWAYIKSKADSLYANITHTHDFSDITSRGESWLEWGGRNIPNGASPVDAAIHSFLGVNRTAFVPASDVSVEYSRDNGSTWIDYNANDNEKTYLFTEPDKAIFCVGKSTSTNVATSDCLLRVVLTSTKIYAEIRKFIILVSTNGSIGCWCTIEGRTVANFNANNDVWSTFANRAPIGGWAGYNVINTTDFNLYNGSGHPTYFKQIRFTFGVTSHNSSYSGLLISNIQCFGVVAFSFPSNMAKSGMLYNFDASQNAIFPKDIRSTKFITSGGTSAQFVKGDGSLDAATYATTAHTHSKDDVGLGNVVNLNQSKAIKSITRSGTTFTATALDGTTTTFTQQDNDTTYSPATTSASGLMSAADKTKLDGIDAEANKTVVDGALDINSDNPVKNKIVTAALEGKANIVHGNHVPETQESNNKVFLRNDNTWATVTPENIGAAAISHSHSDYVTVATTQTISGKKTFSGLMAFTNSLPVNNSMQYFLGIDAFSQGGTVKYADASKMCGMIGAMPVLSAASGISVTNNVMTILPETEGNFYHVYSVPAVSTFTIKIVGLNMAPGYNLRLVLKGSNTLSTDIIFTRPSNDGPNNIHCPYPSAGVTSNRVTVLDLCVYDGPIVKEMVILNSASLATI